MQNAAIPTEKSLPLVDPTTVKLKGNDHVDDSLSMAMLAAARLLGTADGVDYATVYCRSTNAFSPMINTGEDCTAHWACEAWLGTRTVDHLAASLGLQAKKLELPELEAAWDEARKLKVRQGMAAMVRQAMDSGAVVLTTGGWDIGFKELEGKWQSVGPHGFVFWGAAGVVTKADPATGTLLGAHPNGHLDNPIIWQPGMWVLTPSRGAAADPATMDRETLRLAVKRIRASGPFRHDDRAVYGVDAMQRWADHMAEIPGFCASCFSQGPKASVGDAYDNGKRLHKAAL